MAEAVQVEDRADGIRVVTLNAPQRRNALTAEMIRALGVAFDAQPAAFLLRGAGGSFCAGYDVSQVSSWSDAVPSPDASLPDEPLLAAFRRVQHASSPTVALIEGAAYGGGCDLACACDFRIGSRDAVFCIPPARLGLIYAAEGIQRVANRIGTARARWMFLTGRTVDAQTAHGWGLLDEVHPPADVSAAAEALCRDLAQGAPLAVRGMKQILRRLESNDHDSEGEYEIERLRRAAYLSEDAREGRTAFLEKRRPLFKGR
jgi:enoyl-CoA hydratase/carnithine racemase